MSSTFSEQFQVVHFRMFVKKVMCQKVKKSNCLHTATLPGIGQTCLTVFIAGFVYWTAQYQEIG